MSEIRCPECQCLLKDKDLKNDKCWKCGLTPIMERIREEQKFYLEKEEQKKQERLDEKEKKRQEKEQKRQEKEQKRQEKEQILKNITLSEKYGILDIGKFILWIILVVEIVGGFIAFTYVLEKLGVWEMLVVGIIWIFGLLGIYCVINIIDFLFDLDKVKSNKV